MKREDFVEDIDYEEALEKENKEAKYLLEFAICPNCDGSGFIKMLDEPCEWCWTRDQLLGLPKEDENLDHGIEELPF